jgi:hypothetical protein
MIPRHRGDDLRAEQRLVRRRPAQTVDGLGG